MPHAEMLKTKFFDFSSKHLIIVLNDQDARRMKIQPNDRVEICSDEKKKSSCVIAVADIAAHQVKPGEVGIFLEVRKRMGLKRPSKVYVTPIPPLFSSKAVQRKIRGETLTEDQIRQIVLDINDNRLSEIELSALMTAVFIHGFNEDETTFMTKALIDNGQKISFGSKPVLDKHSIGGTNGRASMILVPIIASAGFLIPKTSSRSITSAAGTADSMEVLAPVSLSIDQLKAVVKKTNGCIVWGGSLDLAPVDDKIIHVEHPLNLDPEGQIVASVMAKKCSVGSKKLVLDIPVGPDVKIQTMERGRRLAQRFIQVGKILGMEVEVLLTDGDGPMGRNFGPALEAKEVLEILEGKTWNNLGEKACALAGTLFEMQGYCPKGKGTEKAKSFIDSGKALQKFKEIIIAQGGKITSSDKVPLGRYTEIISCPDSGMIRKINVKKVISIANEAGCPADHGAGLIMLVWPGSHVNKGEPMMEIYAETPDKLAQAVKLAVDDGVIELENVVVGFEAAK